MKEYQVDIGLEIHIQLLTESKVFCSCSTQFGTQPNTQTCPVCLGLPGVLPVLNKKAFYYAVKVALAFNCEISPYVFFDRKNYYYPDLPKNYQISQYALPVGKKGYLEVEFGKKVKEIRIRRVHLEEDAGKLIHSEDGKSSFVDYNRAGIPLLEIVTEPDINSPQEAYKFLQDLRTTILYLDVSDCNMEEGSLRCDCNISVREVGSKDLGTKAELKNMNTFKGVKQALEYEISRQISLLEAGEKVVQETRLWDSNKQTTFSMRTKEEIHDYRYFPEPDLVRYEISQELIKELQSQIPELPLQRRRRFREEYNLSEYDINILTREKFLADYFENILKYYNQPKPVCNFLTTDIIGRLKEMDLKYEEIKLTPENCARILKMVSEGKISIKIAKQILGELLIKDINPETYIEGKGLIQVSEESQLEEAIVEVFNHNEQAVKDYKEGKEKALIFLVGQVMRLTKGKANPAVVNKLLKEKLNNTGGEK